MAEHEAWGGVTVDHLYQNCRALQMAVKRQLRTGTGDIWIGNRLQGTVDPCGNDICGMCRRRYEQKHPTP